MTRCFCWYQNFVPKRLSAPAPGLKSCKELYKIRLQRDFLKLVANDRSDKRFLLTSKFCPWGCLSLTCGYIHLLNYEKMCIKSEVEKILSKLATNDYSDEAFLLISIFWPQWVVCPCPRAMFKLLFLNNRWFQHILSTQMSDTGPMVLWFIYPTGRVCKIRENRGKPCLVCKKYTVRSLTNNYKHVNTTWTIRLNLNTNNFNFNQKHNHLNWKGLIHFKILWS